jgi:hypothetical protein
LSGSGGAITSVGGGSSAGGGGSVVTRGRFGAAGDRDADDFARTLRD